MIDLRGQFVQFADRRLQVEIAARPEFISRRRTSMPTFVLGLSLGMVLVLVCLLSAVLFIQVGRSRAAIRQRIVEEEHKKSVVQAAKEAHEKTIAYACHQLRYESYDASPFATDRLCFLAHLPLRRYE